MPLTAGAVQISAQASVTGATIAPQGTASPNTLNSPTNDQMITGSQSLSYGTASGLADIICVGEFTLNAGANVEWDLFTGTDFKDVFGFTAAFRKIKSICVSILSGGDTAGVTIGNAATDPNPLFFGADTQTWTIYPDGPPMLGGSPAGVAVSNADSNLKILNNGAVAVTIRVMIAGSSV